MCYLHILQKSIFLTFVAPFNIILNNSSIFATHSPPHSSQPLETSKNCFFSSNDQKQSVTNTLWGSLPYLSGTLINYFPNQHPSSLGYILIMYLDYTNVSGTSVSEISSPHFGLTSRRSTVKIYIKVFSKRSAHSEAMVAAEHYIARTSPSRAISLFISMMPSCMK